jgi:hypothetical protein
LVALLPKGFLRRKIISGQTLRKLEPQAQAALVSAFVGAAFGLMGGIVGPIIQGTIQRAGDLNKLKLEAELTRQTKVIDAQNKLLNNITSALWDWRYISISMTYYGRSNQKDIYDKYWKEYDENIWKKLNTIRSLISQSRRLVSEPIFWRLRDFYIIVVELDKQISSAATENDIEKKSHAFSLLNKRIYGEISDEIDKILFEMGSGLALNQLSNVGLSRGRNEN